MALKKGSRPEFTWIENRKQYRKRVKLSDGYHDVYGKTKEELREKLDALKAGDKAGLAIKRDISLVAYAREWYPVKVAGLAPKSAHIYANAINNHIAPYFANTNIGDIKPLDIEKLMATKAALANSTQSKILFTLSQIMESAVKNGLIIKNPCEGIKAGGAPNKKKTPLTSKQQKELTGAVKGTRAELFVLLCLLAGLRREEALGLTWNSVHLDGTPYIDVRHTVTFNKNRPIHSEKLKSNAAYRSIPIPPQLVKALSIARKAAVCNLVIPAEKSKDAMSATAFRRMWGIVTGYSFKKKGKNGNKITYTIPGVVDFHVEPHILRHTYITELCASGMDIKKIQYLAGHEDVNMTLRVYAQVKDNRPEELAKAVNHALGVNLGVKRYRMVKKLR